MAGYRRSTMPASVVVSAVMAAVSLCPLPAFPALALQASKAQRPTGGSVSGVLLAPNDTPQPKTQVRIVKVRLVTLFGKDIRTLPPKDTVIIDSDGKAVAVAETDSSGRFEFKNVPAGRYGLAMPSKAGGSASGQRWLESRGSTVFFDIDGNQRIQLGTVKAEKEKSTR